ncbi:hypothetical protein HYPSUDRAFT_275362 [Hypholoma sublateritium FD-334 SS-4]|uniref:Uncharacterized protein n=1 Tax=Hypholoma sublateritium (strain FD-334 SS-4) TaxID=945553 RepID=A0A0D2MR50_HYPSF|nr:hypothetical protein HYPSUDRAFT_275362 [Hypholoma sublateritium FD-334 SS-4]
MMSRKTSPTQRSFNPAHAAPAAASPPTHSFPTENDRPAQAQDTRVRSLSHSPKIMTGVSPGAPGREPLRDTQPMAADDVPPSSANPAQAGGTRDEPPVHQFGKGKGKRRHSDAYVQKWVDALPQLWEQHDPSYTAPAPAPSAPHASSARALKEKRRRSSSLDARRVRAREAPSASLVFPRSPSSGEEERLHHDEVPETQQRDQQQQQQQQQQPIAGTSSGMPSVPPLNDGYHAAEYSHANEDLAVGRVIWLNPALQHWNALPPRPRFPPEPLAPPPPRPPPSPTHAAEWHSTAHQAAGYDATRVHHGAYGNAPEAPLSQGPWVLVPQLPAQGSSPAAPTPPPPSTYRWVRYPAAQGGWALAPAAQPGPAWVPWLDASIGWMIAPPAAPQDSVPRPRTTPPRVQGAAGAAATRVHHGTYESAPEAPLLQGLQRPWVLGPPLQAQDGAPATSVPPPSAVRWVPCPGAQGGWALAPATQSGPAWVPWRDASVGWMIAPPAVPQDGVPGPRAMPPRVQGAASAAVEDENAAHQGAYGAAHGQGEGGNDAVGVRRGGVEEDNDDFFA